MKLNSYKLGQFIELLNNKNIENVYKSDKVRGVNNKKQLIHTKADITNRDLSKFSIVYPGEFFFNHRTSRHGDKFCITYNYEKEPIIVTEDYTCFKIKDEAKDLLSRDWLFIYFNRNESDRYVMFNSWGSSTEFFNWSDICNIEIEVPSIDIQRKYVAIYNSMLENQKNYERGLEDLKLTCDAYIENLRKNISCEEIGKYLIECNEKNDNLSVTLNQGIDINMQFIPAKREAEDKESNKIVRNNQFAFNKVVKANGTKLPIALRNGEDCIISGSYQVFDIKDKNILLPEYLMMWMSRSETQRFCGFNAWGSTRDVFSFDELCKLKFPIPKIEIQKDVVNIYNTYILRKEINEKLKEKIKNICPILIKGSLEEAKSN